MTDELQLMDSMPVVDDPRDRNTQLGCAMSEEGMQKIKYRKTDANNIWENFKDDMLRSKSTPSSINTILSGLDETRSDEDWAKVNRLFLPYLDERLFKTSHIHFTESHLQMWYDTMACCKGTAILPWFVSQQVTWPPRQQPERSLKKIDSRLVSASSVLASSSSLPLDDQLKQEAEEEVSTERKKEDGDARVKLEEEDGDLRETTKRKRKDEDARLKLQEEEEEEVTCGNKSPKRRKKRQRKGSQQQQQNKKTNKIVSKYWAVILRVHPASHLMSPDAERRRKIRDGRLKKVENKEASETKKRARYGRCPILFFIWGKDRPPLEQLREIQDPIEYQEKAMELILRRMRPHLLADNSNRASGMMATDQGSLHHKELEVLFQNNDETSQGAEGSPRKELIPQVLIRERAQRRAKSQDPIYLEKKSKRRAKGNYGAQTGTEMFSVELGMIVPFLGHTETCPKPSRHRILQNRRHIVADYLERPVFWFAPERYLLSEAARTRYNSVLALNMFLPETPFFHSKSWDVFKSSSKFKEMETSVRDAHKIENLALSSPLAAQQKEEEGEDLMSCWQRFEQVSG